MSQLPPPSEGRPRPVTAVDPSELAWGTFAAIVATATDRAAIYRRMCDQDYANQRAAARDFSRAISALEDATQAFVRGYARLSGQWEPADLEAIDLAAADEHKAIAASEELAP